MIDFTDIEELVDSAREAAERSGVDRAATDTALDAVLAAAREGRNPFDTWREIDGRIGLAESGDLRDVLFDLRECFVGQLTAAEIARLEKVFAHSPEAGWNSWLTTLADAIPRYRTDFCRRLCRHPFPFRSARREEAARLEAGVKHMTRSRWKEANDSLRFLSEQEFLPDLSRARLLAMLGQAQQWQFCKIDRAGEFYEAAAKLAPGDGLILTVQGDYAANVESGGLDAARPFYERAMEVAPGFAGGFTGFGDYFEKLEQFDKAEDWYLKALASAPGDTSGYGKMLAFYSRAELLEEHEAKLTSLLERAVAVDPDAEYDYCITVGEGYRAIHRIDEAQGFFERAIAVDETRPEGFASLAACREDREDYDEAEAFLRRAIELAGDFDRGVYLNSLGNLFYLAGNYPECVEAYRQAIAAYGEEPVYHRNLGLAFQESKDYDEAGEAFEAARRLDDDKGLFNLRMALLCNARANDEYAAGQYREAIDLYTDAIGFDPGMAVLHANLAGGWELLKEPGRRVEALNHAIAAFRKAIAADLAEGARYQSQIERLIKKRGFASRYGEKPLDWLHAVNPVSVEIAHDLTPVIEGSTEGSISEELAAQVTRMRTRIQDEFGVQVPGIRFRGNEFDLSDGVYIIMVNEVPLVSGTLRMGSRFCRGPEEELSSVDVGTEPAYNVESGGEGFWIRGDDCEKAGAKGLELWSEIEYLVRHVEAVLRDNLGELLGHQELANILDAESPGLAEAIHNSEHSEKLSALVTVCRAFLVEKVPIEPFAEFAGAFDRLFSKGVALGEIVESLRSLPMIREALPGNSGRFTLLELGAGFEREIRSGLYKNSLHSVLAMEPERCQIALTAVRDGIAAQTGVEGNEKLALLADTAELRPFVRQLTELEFPDLPVLARSELISEAGAEISGVIDLEDVAAATNGKFQSPSGDGLPSGIFSESGIPGGVAVRVVVSEDLFAGQPELDDQSLEDMLSAMQDGLFYELGVVFPKVQIQADVSLEPNRFKIQINGIDQAPIEGLLPHEFLVNDTVDRLALLEIEGRPAANPVNRTECAIVVDKNGLVDRCRSAGLTTWGANGYLVLVLSAQIRQNAASFQTLEVTDYILDSLKLGFPVLVNGAIDRYGLERISLVLRELLDEEISIRDMRSVLEGLLSINGTTDVDIDRYIVFLRRTDNLCPVGGSRGIEDLETSELSNYVRTTLKNYISHKYTRGGNALVVYLIDPAIEKRLVRIAAEPLSSGERENLISAIREELENLSPAAQIPVLLTSMRVRRTLRKLIEAEFPELAVLSYQELSPETNIQPIARISWTQSE